jgi:short subunit dehydrogenase-like uncharacterized protein
MGEKSGYRPFDIVVWGATGFTGRLVAEYLAKRVDPDGPRWALAGRDPARLESVHEEIGAGSHVPILTADAGDAASMAELANNAEVVLTTVGPYQLYGEPLLRACVEAGTDYTDLCGEPVWMRQMIDRYHEAAKASGARIAFSSGFDSIPFDLGVMMLQKEATARFGRPCPRVKGRVRAMKGTFSGGTAASLKATLAALKADPALLEIMLDPFGLTPGFAGPPQPRGDAVQYDETLGSWETPFVMAAINTKNVHRSNLLLGHPYGRDFVYDEMVLTGPGDAGEAAAKHVKANPAIGGDGGPQPGEGPDKAARDSGFYDLLFVGEMPDGRSLRYGVKGRYDPGYGSTSRMISETALALLNCEASGGVSTPGALLGEALVDRLRNHAEISFGVEE